MIKIRKKREAEEVNSSSMADIAFLLLIFFLVTTTMAVDLGIELTQPPIPDTSEPPKPNAPKNVFKVILRKADGSVLAGSGGNAQIITVSELKENAKRFLDNNGVDPTMSDSPKKAVISLQSNRGTDFKTYIATIDQLEAAYHELRAEKLKISVEDYLKLDKTDPEQNAMLIQAGKAYPWTLSEAEPSEIE